MSVYEIQEKDGTSDQWICPFCGHESSIIINDAVLKNDCREILCGCLKCDEMYIRQYKLEKIIKLIRE